MEFVAVAVVPGPLVPVVLVDLAHGEPVVVLVEHLPYLSVEPMQVGMGEVVDVVLLVPLAHRLVRDPGRRSRLGRVVLEFWILGDEVRHVDSESVNSPIEPEAQHLEHGFPHLRIAPVQIGLLLEERVQVELLSRIVPLPGRPTERRQPVVGHRAVGLCISPHVPVAFRVGP